MSKQFTVEWIDAGGEAQCPADPAWPEGVSLIENPEALAHCVSLLTYPAPGCGVWSLTCSNCGKVVVVTAAGRADDPRAIAVACYRRGDDA